MYVKYTKAVPKNNKLHNSQSCDDIPICYINIHHLSLFNNIETYMDCNEEVVCIHNVYNSAVVRSQQQF
jgi:hypothetical protein